MKKILIPVFYFLFIAFAIFAAAKGHYVSAGVIVAFGIIIAEFSSPRPKNIVSHYKLTNLIDNKGPGLASTTIGSSFHLNGIQFEIITCLEHPDGEVYAIVCQCIEPGLTKDKVALSYPTLLPYGGEEWLTNLSILRAIYRKREEAKLKINEAF